MSNDFFIRVTLECVCGARLEGELPNRRLKGAIHAFRKAHHHPPTRDKLGRFAAWKPA